MFNGSGIAGITQVVIDISNNVKVMCNVKCVACDVLQNRLTLDTFDCECDAV